VLGLFERLLKLVDLKHERGSLVAQRGEIGGGAGCGRGEIPEFALHAFESHAEPGRRLMIELVNARLRSAPNHRRPTDLGQEDGERVLARDRETGISHQREPLPVVKGLWSLGMVEDHLHSRAANRRAAQHAPAVGTVSVLSRCRRYVIRHRQRSGDPLKEQQPFVGLRDRLHKLI
jgi:hypothetical protein